VVVRIPEAATPALIVERPFGRETTLGETSDNSERMIGHLEASFGKVDGDGYFLDARSPVTWQMPERARTDSDQ
jgi:hypothetical protein